MYVSTIFANIFKKGCPYILSKTQPGKKNTCKKIICFKSYHKGLNSAFNFVMPRLFAVMMPCCTNNTH